MFYSQFILSKKGPLGTIWIAAHLERKLRKNQVTETDIPASVDSIMFPEVPIALRLSGHLLLGVVRIYQRKVTYLFQDCNEALLRLKSAFNVAAASVDLPPGAASVPLHSITLPETFEFEEARDAPRSEESHRVDHHVTAREHITLDEPVNEDAYPGSQFEEERFPDAGITPTLTLDEELFKSRDVLEEDVLPPMPVDAEANPAPQEEVPDIEKLRSLPNAAPEESPPFAKEGLFDEAALPSASVQPASAERQLVEDASLRTPSVQRTPTSPFVSFASPASGIGAVDETPTLAVVETPVRYPKRRKLNDRKRKITYDDVLALDATVIRGTLEDTSDLCRGRKKLCTAEEVYVYQKEHLGKHMFQKPCVPGLCPQLQDIYGRRIAPKEAVASPSRQTSKGSPPGQTLTGTPSSTSHHDVAGTPPAVAAAVDPATPDGPAASVDAEPALAPDFQHRVDAHVEPSPGVLQEQVVMPEQELDLAVQDIQEDGNAGSHWSSPAETTRATTQARSEEAQERMDTSFLLEPTEEQFEIGDSRQSEGWSARTRVVAQFLRTMIEAVRGPGDASSRKVSLHQVLTSKSRKDAARMFFETLVLRSNDYIQAEQQGPYQDIDIYARPKLMKAAF